MNLAAIAARRLLLSRGASFLAAAFVTAGGKSEGRHGRSFTEALDSRSDQEPPTVTFGRSPRELNKEQRDRRRELAAPLYDKQCVREREVSRRYDAWFNQDADLLALASTSRAWRASVMRDRLKREAAFVDAIQEKINAIWHEPFEQIEAMAEKFLREMIE